MKELKYKVGDLLMAHAKANWSYLVLEAKQEWYRGGQYKLLLTDDLLCGGAVIREYFVDEIDEIVWLKKAEEYVK